MAVFVLRWWDVSSENVWQYLWLPFIRNRERYIKIRFPKININDIVYEKVIQQTGNINCGIFAILFAVYLALGADPCSIKCTKYIKLMRQHLFSMIENETLMFFP